MANHDLHLPILHLPDFLATHDRSCIGWWQVLLAQRLSGISAHFLQLSSLRVQHSRFGCKLPGIAGLGCQGGPVPEYHLLYPPC